MSRVPTDKEVIEHLLAEIKTLNNSLAWERERNVVLSKKNHTLLEAAAVAGRAKEIENDSDEPDFVDGVNYILYGKFYKPKDADEHPLLYGTEEE